MWKSLTPSLASNIARCASSVKLQSAMTVQPAKANVRFQSTLTEHKSSALSASEKEEMNQMKESLKKIIDTHINPFVDEWEAAKNAPLKNIIKRLGEAGFLGITRPVRYGGLGLDYRYTLAFAETLGLIKCGGIPMAITVHTDMATPALASFGSEELKQEFLVPSIAGDLVSCIAVSEPSAGSDVANIKTTAKRQGDDYIINGQKMWITNARHADWVCLLANTSQEASHNNKSLIIVPMKAPGVSIAKNITKIGMYSSDTNLIYFDNVRVPCKNLIGKEGKGFMYQMNQFQQERLIASINVLPALEMCIQETIEYTKQRKAFGGPILNNQVVHFRLAEMQTEIEALRALVHRCADIMVQGEDVTQLASMAKLKAGRLGREVTDGCLQYWGGMGYTDEVLVSRMFRDMRLMSIGGGADEVMLGIICKYMGTLPKKGGL